jgi:hypothetical protein
MSVAEIIEMIKKLPPSEQAEVIAFAEEVKSKNRDSQVNYLPADEAERIADQIFEQNKELFRRLAQ